MTKKLTQADKQLIEEEKRMALQEYRKECLLAMGRVVINPPKKETK